MNKRCNRERFNRIKDKSCEKYSYLCTIEMKHYY